MHCYCYDMCNNGLYLTSYTRYFMTQQKAPRVTPEQVDALLGKLTFEFLRTGKTGTICSAYLGTFRVAQGYAASVSVENFDPEIGERISKDDCWAKSKNKLWELLGFALFKDLNPELFSCVKSK